MGFALKKLRKETTSNRKAHMGILLKLILKEPEWESVDWLYLAQDRDKRQEICTLLVYYAAYSGNSLPTLGTTYCCHLQGSRIKELDSSPMKMRPIGCPETSVRYLLTTTRCK
jgi:hypothetical protein